MSKSMFIHACVPIKAQIRQMQETGFVEEAAALQAVLRRIERGQIRTLTQLRKEQEEIKWKNSN